MTLNDFERATNVVQKVTVDTGLTYSDYFSFISGNSVYLKPENMQKTGAYKIRGAYYKISTLTDAERERGLVAASAGNHAQGVAYAAREYGCKATIVMPTTTPLIKVNRTKDLGAEVILRGDIYDDSANYALKLSKEKGYTFINPFDDLAVATGQGSIAMEIIKELPLVDYILVPVGGGGLLAGIATLVKLLKPNVNVIGVEPKGAASLNAAMESGKPVPLDSISTIADGTAVKKVGETIFPYIRDNLDDIILVEDDELVVAFLDMVENHKMIVENSGLLTVAALKHLREMGVENKKVVAILSGGNMDVITMSTVVQHGLIARGRIFTFSVLLPDKPGELLRIAEIIAKNNGNVIRLDHNQFVNIDRNAGVELKVTLETYGSEHKDRIIESLQKEGYEPRQEAVLM